MKNLSVNTISNIVTKLWSMISIYLFIPLYIDILGETSYGLVSFFATLQSALNILGLGLSNTLRREFASGEDTIENTVKKYKLLRSIENIYFLLGAVIVCICAIGSTSISQRWLNIESLDSEMVASVISLMGCSIALQLIANLYAGCLFGLNHQVLANIICIIWSAAKSIGVLIIIAIISQNLVFFYGWHILVDLLYLIIFRIFVLHKLNLKIKVRWRWVDFVNISTIWKYASGILFISFIVLINKQLDKVVISKYLTLTELGAYNVATTLGSLSSIIPTALYATVFPRFTNYATTKNKIVLEKEFMQINRLVGLVLSAMGAYIAVYAIPLIQIWTRSDSYTSILGNVGTLVVLAVTVTEYQEIPYALALANGNTKYNVIVGGIFIPIIFVSTYLGIINYGLLGAGIVYLIMMMAQTLLYEFLVYRKYLKISPVLLILKDTIIPFVVCFGVAVISKLCIEKVTTNPIAESAFAVLMGAITLGILLILTVKKNTRNILIKNGGKNK